MRTEPIIFLSTVIVFLFLVDVYAFKGIRQLLKTLDSANVRKGITTIYWLFSFVIYGGFIFMMMNMDLRPSPKGSAVFNLFMGLAILSLVPKLIFLGFHFLEDVGFLTMKVGAKISSNSGQPISRSSFLTKIGLLVASVPFFAIIYGMIKGKYDFKIVRKKLYFSDLPDSFEGLTAVHISDAHLGSFNQAFSEVSKGLEMINSVNPDLIFFTGDMVNNFAQETEGWVEPFSKLKAKHGKFSILGNHDYGDYSPWESKEDKRKNLEGVKQFHKDIGFDLLLNENKKLTINGESIRIIGLENWGKGFSQYGNLSKSMRETTDDEFQIMLSHDPTHWDAEINKKTKVNLTLSGHTHGMQFGVNLGKFRYSPAQHRYKQWSGLYNVGKQFLYVNQGFGFLGFPGRVGMPPEITVLEFHKQA